MINREQYQTEGDFHEQRKQFRAEALDSLREREGLPKPEYIDGQWVYRYPDGTTHPWAIGRQKGLPIEVADEFWSGPDAIHFEIEEISRDGVSIEKELRDLDRDAQLVADTQNVSHGEESEPFPELKLNSLTDPEVERAIQRFIENGK